MTRGLNLKKAWKPLLVSLLLTGICVYFFAPILLPFISALVIAYLLNPLVNKLEKKGLNRTYSTLILVTCAITFIFTILLLGVPLIIEDISTFVQKMPSYMEWLKEAFSENGIVQKQLATHNIVLSHQELINKMQSYSTNITSITLKALQKLALGTLAAFDLISLLLIMPMVVFYVLRDWPKIIKSITSIIPKPVEKDILAITYEVDLALSSFLRGQGMVCLTQGLFYGIGLTFTGLQMGFLIGFATGILAFIPYVGMILGMLAALIMAIVQFQFTSIEPFIWIAIVFAVGQLIESFILTPYFVGNKVGLHPVWVIFALMAGGEIGGFLGILIALPLATILTVLIPILVHNKIPTLKEREKKA